jgi:hypothetical protein
MRMAIGIVLTIGSLSTTHAQPPRSGEPPSAVPACSRRQGSSVGAFQLDLVYEYAARRG